MKVFSSLAVTGYTYLFGSVHDSVMSSEIDQRIRLQKKNFFSKESLVKFLYRLYKISSFSMKNNRQVPICMGAHWEGGHDGALALPGKII